MCTALHYVLKEVTVLIQNIIMATKDIGIKCFGNPQQGD